MGASMFVQGIRDMEGVGRRLGVGHGGESRKARTRGATLAVVVIVRVFVSRCECEEKRRMERRGEGEKGLIEVNLREIEIINRT